MMTLKEYFEKHPTKKARIEALETELAELATAYGKLKTAYGKLETKNEKLKSDKEKLKAEKEEAVEKAKKRADKYKTAKEEAEQCRQQAKTLESKLKHVQQEKRQMEKKRTYLPAVMKATGWDLDTADAKMERAKQVAGSSYENYANFRFWELTEEEQKTYFNRQDMVCLRRKYNTDKKIVETMKNKDSCCALLEPYLGRPWMLTENMTFDTFCEKFGNEKKIVYKLLASSGGRGIKAMELTPDTLREVYDEIAAMPAGLIEGYLTQHPEMAKFTRNSVNTIRVVTVNTKDDIPGVEKNKVHFLFAGMRLGQGDSIADNLHSGGMVASVDIDTGVVLTGGIDYRNIMHEVHPDTNIPIKGFQIPMFQEIKDMIVRASTDIPGFFGWDIAITETGPVVVEVNTSPDVGVLQMPYVPEKKGMRYVVEKYL